MHRIEEIGCGNAFGLLNRSGTLVVRGSWAGRNILRWHEFQPRRSYNSLHCSWEVDLLIWAFGTGSTPIPIDQIAHMFDHCCQCHGFGGPYEMAEVEMARESYILLVRVCDIEKWRDSRSRKLLKNDEADQ